MYNHKIHQQSNIYLSFQAKNCYAVMADIAHCYAGDRGADLGRPCMDA
jgi:hypothetical protein